MSELPGMWDESDLQGGESDCHEMAISMFANSAEYWRHHCEHARAENAALKEENERLFALNAEVCGEAVKVSKERDALKARVAELERRAISTDGRLQGARLVAQRFISQAERLKSVGAIMSNACYNMSQWGERLPEGQAEVLKGLYKAWDEAIKEPANEG